MSWSRQTRSRTEVSAEFVTSAVGAGDFPRDRLPEVAMVGRSNVGKSSLINALVRCQVARTSAAPGKTRLANFYRVQAGRRSAFYLVDLPGYGYARGAHQGDRHGTSALDSRAAAAEQFRQLAEVYFARDTTRGALLLVDARHPGLDSDLAAWEWLQSRPVPTTVVATKVDKLTRAERARHSQQLERVFDGPVRLVSAYSGEGLEELWKLIVRLPDPTATAEP